MTPGDAASLFVRLAEPPWPADEGAARVRLGAEGLTLGPSSSFPFGLTGPVHGAPAEWDMTWFRSSDGFALNLFVAETTPTDRDALQAVAAEYIDALDSRAERSAPETLAPTGRGWAWRSGSTLIELDCIDGHRTTGVVQVHLRSTEPGPEPGGHRPS